MNEIKECIWVWDEEGCVYESSCGGQFVFDIGTASQNSFSYCPFCGCMMVDLLKDDND